MSVAVHNIQKVETPECPSTDKQINKTWNIHTMDCSSAIKRNEVQIQSITWMKLENIMLSGERSESKKTTYYIIPLI